MDTIQSLANATTEIGLAREEINDIANVAQNQITRVGDHYTSILSKMEKVYFVDTENGDDGAEGTLAAPMKTVQKAVSLVPRGSILYLRMLSDLHVDQTINIQGITLVMQNDKPDQTNVRVTFERKTFGSSIVYRVLKGFVLGNNSHLFARHFTFVMPELAHYNAFVMGNGHIFQSGDDWGVLSVTMYFCTIEIPATPFCSFFNHTNLIRFHPWAMTYEGAITDPKGHWFASQTNKAGVAASSLPWLQTHLTTV